jgi:hypothetical protein
VLSSQLFHCRFTSLIRRVEVSGKEIEREKQTEREACTEHANVSIPTFPSGGWGEEMVAVQLISVSCITYIQLDRFKVSG